MSAIDRPASGFNAASGERLELIHGGGWVAILGAVPLLLGFVGLCKTLSRGSHDGAGSSVAILGEILGDLVFITIGAVLVFGRCGHVLDRHERRAVSWWGLMRPWFTRTRPLQDFDRVGLDRRVVSSGKSSRVIFPVELQGSGAPLALEHPATYESARRRAEEVANFLGLNLHDSTAGAPCVRESGRLNESLREQALRSGETVEWLELPEGSRIEYRTEGEEAIIVLPPTRIAAAKRAIGIALMLVGVDVAVFMFLPFLVPGIPTVLLTLGLVLSVLGAFAIAVALFFKPGRLAQGEGERIVVSARELRCHGGVFGSSAPRAIAAEELEELHIEPSVEHPVLSMLGLTGGLVARSDSQTLRFGAGLSPAERQWLHDVIRYIITDAQDDEDESRLSTQSARC